MEKLVEIMLNEGLDEDTIVNVISNLMNEEVEEETPSLSESCFNDIISLVEELIYEKTWGLGLTKALSKTPLGGKQHNDDIMAMNHPKIYQTVSGIDRGAQNIKYGIQDAVRNIGKAAQKVKSTLIKPKTQFPTEQGAYYKDGSYSGDNVAHNWDKVTKNN